MNIKKNYKNILILLMFFPVVLWLSMKTSTDGDSPLFWAFMVFPPVIFGFNFLVRNFASFKPYFLSKWNFLTSKYEASISSEIPPKLMFQKMIEVLSETDLHVKSVDADRLEIFATTSVTFRSWGENIYIEFEKNEKQTVMNFYSATVVGIISWGQNEKNYNRLLSRFEDSLTV